MKAETKDIILRGSEILKDIASKYPNGVITDLKNAETFFAQIMDVMKGLVIVDFLDTDNWDNIKGVRMDLKQGLLFVYWKIPRIFEDPLLEEMEKMVFPLDTYGLAIPVICTHLKSRYASIL